MKVAARVFNKEMNAYLADALACAACKTGTRLGLSYAPHRPLVAYGGGQFYPRLDVACK